MKKLIFLLLLIPAIGSAQQIKKVISTKKVGSIDCKFNQLIEDGDTSHYLYCGFQNQKYEYVTDIGSLMFVSQEELDSFLVDLKSANGYLQDNEKQTITYKRDQYTLSIYDWASTKLYITDEDGKYTTLSRKLVADWIEWLTMIQFP